MLLAPVRSDTLPEHSTYRDDGCELWSCCLECPLPMCKYDDPGWFQRENRRSRDEAIVRLRREQRVSVPEVAARFGVSTRTVHRVLQAGGETRGAPGADDEGPTIPVLELAGRSLFRRRTPFPPLDPAPAAARRSA
ncbi:MAG: helix-turn-helix domain-containing protein, partial [Gemmatimonadetes bacterium]|nr:helix-turn-helix domain-containing protein [Gemmatimonadota bacterium]